MWSSSYRFRGHPTPGGTSPVLIDWTSITKNRCPFQSTPNLQPKPINNVGGNPLSDPASTRPNIRARLLTRRAFGEGLTRCWLFHSSRHDPYLGLPRTTNHLKCGIDPLKGAKGWVPFT